MEKIDKDWNGTRVFFWASDAQIRYGTVLDTTRLIDGTQVLSIKPDNGEQVSLPWRHISAFRVVGDTAMSIASRRKRGSLYTSMGNRAGVIGGYCLINILSSEMPPYQHGLSV
ncbi:hypothetical protein FPV67DRAFT_314619 [Lyophyllum atratum]|nr:hypothetical protein FPV67DRAFT_314619 [Lyophyllum atratum]